MPSPCWSEVHLRGEGSAKPLHPPRELRVVENLADETFGEQVLHQHFIDGGDADVGIERLLAEREKAIEGGLELLVGLVRLGDFLDLLLGEFRHALLELIDGLLETHRGKFTASGSRRLQPAGITQARACDYS